MVRLLGKRAPGQEVGWAADVSAGGQLGCGARGRLGGGVAREELRPITPGNYYLKETRLAAKRHPKSINGNEPSEARKEGKTGKKREEEGKSSSFEPDRRRKKGVGTIIR